MHSHPPPLPSSPCRWGTWQAPPSVVYCSASSSLWTPVCRHSSRRWVRPVSPGPEESWPPQVSTHTHTRTLCVSQSPSEAITVVLALLPPLSQGNCELWNSAVYFKFPFVCACVHMCTRVFLHLCRLGAAPCWSARPQCVHPVEPLRCPRLDASDTDGPEWPSQRPTAYRGTHTQTLTHTETHTNMQLNTLLV